MDDHLRRRLTLVVAWLVAAGCQSAASAPPTARIVELPLRTVQSEACPDALLPDVRLEVDPTGREPLVGVVANGERLRLVFPAGTRAALHLDRGAVEIVMPRNDRVLVGENERVSFGGGGMGGEGDDRFFACSIVR
jgi:hypothetical protein